MAYSVCVLIRDEKAVYVGCTDNVSRRIKQHKSSKRFDKHIVMKTYDSKEKALNAENAIISFLTLFGDGNWYNSENILLSHTRDCRIRSNSRKEEVYE